ncbi:sugar ABC transporter permease [Clavibacter michiganensis]|nr:sugar ABC transporter permease [Clavibacter michiganensis]
MFMAPALALYALIVLYPLATGALLSLTDSTVGNGGDFVGLANFIELASDPDVLDALRVTVLYAVVVVILQNAAGLALARALYRRMRVRRTFSVLVLLPTLISAVMAAFIWSYLFAPDGGINAVLRAVGLQSLQRVWLGDPDTALWSIAAVNIWMFAGYSCAIFLAGYLALPAELLDAAQVDGASSWRQFTAVEWPLLAPALTVNVTLALIGCLKVFELPFVMTNGGPAGTTRTLSIIIFEKIFGGEGNFAYGVAVSLLLLVVVVVLAASTQSLLRRREERI